MGKAGEGGKGKLMRNHLSEAISWKNTHSMLSTGTQKNTPAQWEEAEKLSLQLTPVITARWRSESGVFKNRLGSLRWGHSMTQKLKQIRTERKLKYQKQLSHWLKLSKGRYCSVNEKTRYKGRTWLLLKYGEDSHCRCENGQRESPGWTGGRLWEEREEGTAKDQEGNSQPRDQGKMAEFYRDQAGEREAQPLGGEGWGVLGGATGMNEICHGFLWDLTFSFQHFPTTIHFSVTQI